MSGGFGMGFMSIIWVVILILIILHHNLPSDRHSPSRGSHFPWRVS
jgi:uncharacterized membrane protein